MISQLFILSTRGDTIITRDFRGNLVKSTHETFFRNAQSWHGDPPPVFNIEGVNFLHIKRGGLYLLVTTQYNISAAFVLEVLQRLAGVIKDLCGVLTEESIRKNFVYVYEIIDEAMDCGYPQSVTTDQIRPYLVNEPVLVDPSAARRNLIQSSTLPYNAVQRPIGRSKKGKNEIFVDVFEKLSVLFNANGYIVNSSIDGCIQMKSYLRGNPQLRLGLNEDLIIGRNRGSLGTLVLDDCNFHECVNPNDFDEFKVLNITPPDGEFIVMNYRINGEYQTPFRIFPFLEELSPYKLELLVKIRACVPDKNYGANVLVRIQLPSSTSSVSFEKPKTLSGQTTEYKSVEKVAEWNLKKFPGNSEHSVKLNINLAAPNSSKEVGPISIQFEVPMFNVSGVNIKYLRIAEQGKSDPCKWVRYVTQASSYVCRI